MARNRSVVARIVVVGLVAATAIVVVPVLVFGPPTWVPDALVPSFLDRRMGPTVALVPAHGWSDAGPSSATEMPIGARDPEVALLARPEGDDPWAQVAYATVTEEPTVVVDESVETREGVFPLSAGGVTGLIGVDDYSGHRWATMGRGERHLTLWAGFEVTHDALADISVAIDVARPLERQKLPDGWTVATTTTAELAEGVKRTVTMPVTEPGGFMEVTTRAGVGPAAMWLVGSSTVADRIEVRGRPGLITGLDRDGPITLTWTEEPGITVQLTYVSDRDDNMLEALRLANDLRPVDQPAWSRLVEDADLHHVVEPLDPESAPPPPVTVLGGQLADGRNFRVEERGGARLCVVIDGPHPFDRCDGGIGTGRAGSTSALPRLVDPDDLLVEERSPLLAYGYLPERQLTGDWGQVQEALGDEVPTGQAVSVHVADIRGRSYGTATIVGGAWAVHIHDIDLGLVVTYTFADGTTLEVEPDPGTDPGGEGA